MIHGVHSYKQHSYKQIVPLYCCGLTVGLVISWFTLGLVGMPLVDELTSSHGFYLGQRVGIARALAMNPRLLIAD